MCRRRYETTYICNLKNDRRNILYFCTISFKITFNTFKTFKTFKMPRSLILDTETNGIGTFRPARQRIVQWSWITPDGEERNYFVKGADEISQHVPHDITVEKLNEVGKTFEEVYDIFKTDLENCDRVVAHNAIFDMSSIRNEMKLRGFSEEERDVLRNFPLYCTMKNSTQYCAIPQMNKKGEKTKSFKWPRLEELYNVLFGHSPEGTLHDSLWDCRILKNCLEEGIKKNVFV